MGSSEEALRHHGTARSRHHLATWLDGSVMTSKKKNHFISAFLLRNFASQNDQLRVLPVNGRRSYVGAVNDTAHRNNANRVSLLNHDNPDVFEDLQAELEGEVASIVAAMEKTSKLPSRDHDRDLLERFMVLHLARHPHMTELMRSGTELDLGELHGTSTGKMLTQDFLVHAVSFTAVLGRPEHAFTGDEADRWTRYREEFARFSWSLVRYDAPSLVVGDKLVCLSGLAGTNRDNGPERQYSLFGSGGLSTCERITVPLYPHLGLLLSRGGKVSRLRAEAFNRTTVRNCRDFVAFSTRWPEQAKALHADVLNVHREQARLITESVFTPADKP